MPRSRSSRSRRFSAFEFFSYQNLEKRNLLSGSGLLGADASTYEPGLDPSIGAIATAFIQNDVENPNDPWDILTGWRATVDEFVSIGINEITFAVFRQVQNGNLSGGPSNATVQAAVEYANENNISVTILPLFETESGWRGEYNPTGETRTQFQTQYKQWLTDLASIPGIDRFNIGTELNRMVNDPSNYDFFVDLIYTVKETFQSVGNQDGRVGYAANHDAYDSAGHINLLSHPELDFLGVSAYGSIIDANDAWRVAGTGEISEETFQLFVDNWTDRLDDLSAFAQSLELPILIQEFGAVQQNYVSAAPWSTEPGNWVAENNPDRFAQDALEQRAAYESLVTALNGRGDEFESVVFWTWEHQASRGQRTLDLLGTTGGVEKFAIWSTDGGAGEYVTEFLATQQQQQQSPQVINGVLTVEGTANNDTIELVESESTVLVTNNGNETLYDKSQITSITVEAGAGNDFIQRSGLTTIVVTQDGGAGDDLLVGGSGTDILIGGDGNDRLFGNDGDDELRGKNHDDLLNGGEGNDKLYGDNGNDTLIGQNGDDFLNGGAGDDELHGSNGEDTLLGGLGVDLMYGGSGNDVLNGHDGNDLLYGGTGNDRLVGSGDDDQLYGGDGVDQLFGLDGDDILHGLAGNDFLNGGEGNDQLYGSDGDDSIYGSNGNDVLYGGTGDDVINGQSGDDVLYGGTENDRLVGDVGDDVIYGGDGADNIYGLDGNDEIYGLAGTDLLRGGNGDDLIHGGADNDNLNGQAGHDKLFGEQGDDVLDGNVGNDIVVGGAGNDNVYGGAGNDLVIGGYGNDFVRGLAGDDIVVGNALSIETDVSKLQTLIELWVSTDSYEERISELRDGYGNVAQQLPVDSFFSTTDIEDEQLDRLFGDGGLDFFWGDSAEVRDVASNESVG